MEEKLSGRRSKKQIAPKITHTTITISKSTPFLISKHHLDDTQMRNALKYDDNTVKNNHQRTYSYKGEVISCVNSGIKQRFETFQSPSSPIPTPNHHEKREQYYPSTQNKFVQVQEKTLKPRVFSNQESAAKVSGKKKAEVQLLKQTKKTMARMDLNDYGMQQAKHLVEARKNLEKQTQKLRKMYQKSIQKQVKVTSTNKINDLEEQIKQLKIKNLQLQKQRLLSEYNNSKHMIDEPFKMEKANRIQSSRQRYTTIQSILRKPRFKIKHQENDDTDSSFSSFELE